MWKIILPISAIASFIAAYVGGVNGENIQEENFDDSTVLGIRIYHWFWIWIFCGGYLFGLEATLIRYASVSFSLNDGIISSIMCIFVVIPYAGYAYFIYLMYMILSGELLEKRNIVIRFLAFIALYIVGLFICYGLDWICMKILSFLIGLFN